MNKTLTKRTVQLMALLMLDETIAEKVKSANGEGKSFEIFDIDDNTGNVTLGVTRFKWWNQLIKCQVKLPFTSWALAVWDALVSLSKGNNAIAIEEGLSVEIAKKAQRESEFNWVVERLCDVYDHVVNNKNGGASLEGDREKSGPSVIVRDRGNAETIVNVNVSDMHKTFRFPDATGQAFLDVEMGVVGLGVSKK
jgi:hypothetical protein